MKRELANNRILTWVVLVAALLGAALMPLEVARAGPPPPTPASRMLELEAQPNVPSLGTGSVEALGSVTLHAVADTMIAQGKPTKNYWSAGSAAAIRVGYEDRTSEGQGIMRGLLRFNLSAIPAGSTINSAALRLYYSYWRDVDVGEYMRITTYRVTDPWMEELVTWSNRPGSAEAYGSLNLVAGGYDDFHYYDWTVTDLVQAWVDGSYPNHGLLLRGDETSSLRGFFSWESGPDYEPQLVVNYTPPPPTLSAAPSPLVFSIDAGGGSISQDVAVINAGTGTLNWSATVVSGDSWLSLGGSSGTAGPLSPQELEVTVDTSGLSPGVHEGQIRISSSTPGVQGSPQLVQVNLNYGDSGLPHKVYLPLVIKSGEDTSPPTSLQKPIAAVVVGIADYEHMLSATAARAGAPGRDLLLTTFDAGDIEYTLENKGGCCCGTCGLSSTASTQSNNVLLLTDAQATKVAIRDAITKWLDVHEDEDTLVVLFFSGHGMYDYDDNGDENDPYDEFIVPYDLDCDPCWPQVENPVWLPETAISDDELDSWLDELESNQIVVVIDSCFSGGMVEGTAVTLRGLSQATAEGDVLAPLEVGDGFALDVSQSGRIVLMASREDQESAELSSLKNGAFSYYLIQALWSRAADSNVDGSVSAEEAFTYLNNYVDNKVYDETGFHQNPQKYDGVPGQVGVTCP